MPSSMCTSGDRVGRVNVGRLLLAMVASLFAGGCGPNEGSDQSPACDKVDILFVVDNSGSMGDNQQNLVSNFPKFADNIRTSLGSDIDYHVGVVTTDAYTSNAPGCDRIGALVTQTAGAESGGTVCGPFKHGRFLTRDDALTDGFRCAAQVGSTGGSHEDVIGAAAAAVATEMNVAGACNAEFVRPDSLLVLVLITDEDTVTGPEMVSQLFASAGSAIGVGSGPENLPAAWRTRIAVASGHDPDTTVVVSLAKGVPGNVCTAAEQGTDGTSLIAFTNQYKYHYVGDICAPDYGNVLVSALAPVSTACAQFGAESSEESDGETCQDTGPGTKQWLAAVGATVGVAALMVVVGLSTLSRGLARGGTRSSHANLSGIGLGVTFGGLAGIVVTLAQGCGFVSGPAWLGLGTLLLGVAILVFSFIGARR